MTINTDWIDSLAINFDYDHGNFATSEVVGTQYTLFDGNKPITIAFQGKHPELKKKLSLESREENGLTIYRFTQKEQSVFDQIYKERFKHYEKVGREPSSVFMNRNTYRNLLQKSRPYNLEPVDEAYRSWKVFGMEIKENNYLEDGQIIPYREEY